MGEPVLFAVLLGLCGVIYVLADGFDLGIGILSLIAPREDVRDAMVEELEPIWDGNETWLVMGASLLWAAFPMAFAVLLPAFYLPVIGMLLALILRGVAIGFRGHATRFRPLWDAVFGAGSVVAVLAQGMILGGLINGVAVRDGRFAGGATDVFSLLGLLCGLGLIGGYALLGAAWLIWRSHGNTRTFAREAAHAALIVTTVMLFVVSLWTLLVDPQVTERWFGWPTIMWLAPVPLLALVAAIAAWFSLWGEHRLRPLLLAVVIFLCGFVGLAVSLWPYAIPRSVTIWAAASDPQSLRFIAMGLVIVLPVVLAYQANAYRIFGRKPATPSKGYGA